LFIVIILDKINPIWATDEYAIKDLRSFCRIQFNLVAVAPIILILINHMLNLLILLFINIENRRIPYPPNFNKIAAKIIDPSKGASTWALGSHKWKKNIGNFAKNASINNKGILIFLQLIIILIILS